MNESDGRSAPGQENGVGGRQGRARSGSGSVSSFDRWMLGKVMATAGEPPVAVALWDGEVAWEPRQEAVARVYIRERRVLQGLLFNPELNFGEHFSAGRIEVEGSLLELLQAIYRGLHKVMPPGSWKRNLMAWLNRPRNSNSLEHSRENIHRHYDLGNDFYRLWLDPGMVYTCAYFQHEAATLEQAQVAKMDHVCRKLQLAPGQQVVEAGCGWGALAMHMAAKYGARVRAYNISSEQIAFARERVRRSGLADRVEFVEDDYRNIERSCDAFVSVGMLEHVGLENYRTLGGVIKRVLRPGGRGLIHSIGRNYSDVNNPWIERRIFPGSRPPTLAQMMQIFEPHAFSVLDVENLRLHYARTCQAWLDNFDRVSGQVRDMYDENFVRAWRLYLAGSVSAFAVGTMQLFQVVFAHANDSAVPMTREHLYQGS